jgi:GNAT superfamily N-acetyltransferase
MELRPYCESDESVCKAWFSESDPFVGPEWLPAAMRARCTSPEHHALFVGWESGEPLSIVSVSRDLAGKRAGVSLLVSPDGRRMGAGRATIEAVRDAFPEVKEFIGWVDPENDASIGLLNGLGFVKTAFEAPERELFAWRRDETPPPDDWEQPTFPRPW